jgi:3alpha(or 20beta)-hydroxysteroid dehydrogenase
VIIITEAAQGQGAAVARACVADGASVVLCDLRDDACRRLARELGVGAVHVHLDVTSDSQWGDAVAAALRAFGRVTGLLNNAGVVHRSSIIDTAPSDYRRVIEGNQVGVFLGMRAVAEAIEASGGGAIVNVASTEGILPSNGLAAYASSKWAVRGLTRVGALELASRNIRVNCLLPGVVDTPMMAAPAGVSPDDYMAAGQPIARAAHPFELAAVAVFMLSRESSYLTGSEIVVDGRATAGVLSSRLPGFPLHPTTLEATVDS